MALLSKTNVASSLILKLTFEAAYELGKVFFYKKEKKKRVKF